MVNPVAPLKRADVARRASRTTDSALVNRRARRGVARIEGRTVRCQRHCWRRTAIGGERAESWVNVVRAPSGSEAATVVRTQVVTTVDQRARAVLPCGTV